jgi:hypothetical protein
MQALWNDSNLRWVGFYLPVTGKGLSDKLTWSKTFGLLRSIGWGVAPLYLGKQPNSQKLSLKRGEEQLEGYMDGIEAAGFASQEGMPRRTIIYFDQEIPSGSAPWLAYYFGWVKAVIDQGYRPGIYCSYTIAGTITNSVRQRSADAAPEVWVWNVDKYPAHQSYSDLNDIPAPDPVGAGGAAASSWQYVQGSKLTVLGRIISPVDFDSSTFSDPGQRMIVPL